MVPRLSTGLALAGDERVWNGDVGRRTSPVSVQSPAFSKSSTTTRLSARPPARRRIAQVHLMSPCLRSERRAPRVQWVVSGARYNPRAQGRGLRSTRCKTSEESFVFSGRTSDKASATRNHAAGEPRKAVLVSYTLSDQESLYPLLPEPRRAPQRRRGGGLGGLRRRCRVRVLVLVNVAAAPASRPAR